MYELNRIHLRSIGPDGARFDDVTLDLTEDAGRAALATVFHLARLWHSSGGVAVPAGRRNGTGRAA
jgi:hypothetical protein